MAEPGRDLGIHTSRPPTGMRPSRRVATAIEAGQDHTVEYRVITSQGSTLWLRDLVHVVRGAQGPEQLRGLMVDVTDRKRAEQALRKSERKYSEAFRART